MNPSQSTATTQQLALDSAVGNAIATTLTNGIQGQGTLAGQAALSRVEAAITAKQANLAKSPGHSTPASGGGFSNVQNLMASLDNITINNGRALPSGITSSGAASGYSTVQNLMSSFDNITINNPSAGTGGTSLLNGGNPLAAVDQVIATPKFNVKV